MPINGVSNRSGKYLSMLKTLQSPEICQSTSFSLDGRFQYSLEMIPRRRALALVVVYLSVSAEATSRGVLHRDDGSVTSKPNIVIIQPDNLPWINTWGEAPPSVRATQAFNRNLSVPYMNRFGSPPKSSATGFNYVLFLPRLLTACFRDSNSRLSRNTANTRHNLVHTAFAALLCFDAL